MGIENTLGKEWDFWFNTIDQKNARLNCGIENTYYFVFDCVRNKIEYMSDEFFKIFGWTNRNVDFELIFDSIHPDDYQYVMNCEKQVVDFMETLSYQEHFRYYYSYSYRFRSASGGYFTIFQQYHALAINEVGVLIRTIVNCEVVLEEVERRVDDFKIYDHIRGININQQKKINLTKREKEIIELINLGLSSSDISERLFLSKHTVDTHRKNMLQKNDVGSMQELIRLVLF